VCTFLERIDDNGFFFLSLFEFIGRESFFIWVGARFHLSHSLLLTVRQTMQKGLEDEHSRNVLKENEDSGPLDICAYLHMSGEVRFVLAKTALLRPQHCFPSGSLLKRARQHI